MVVYSLKWQGILCSNILALYTRKKLNRKLGCNVHFSL
jgi:hypothetical protein